MDYQTYKPMTKPSRPRKTFTRSNFAEHNYNYTHSSKPNYLHRKNNNHVSCNYWNLPNTSTNSVNFQNNSHPPQDHSEKIIHFFNKIKVDNKHPIIPIIYHQMMMTIFNPTFLHHIHKNIAHKDHDNRSHPEISKIYPQNPTDMQNQQPMHIPNSINTQYFQPIQSQNPMKMHSYQPNQMQNETPLPYYLQQHEITKNQLTNFSNIPNAAESLQMTMNLYLMGGSSITSNKPLLVFTGTDAEYSVEDYLNAVTVNLILNIGLNQLIHHFIKIGYTDAPR